MKQTNIAKAKEIIEKECGFGKQERLRFGQIAYCPSCHGVKGFYEGNKIVKDVETGMVLALLEHGSLMKAWEQGNVGNSAFIPNPCECSCDHEFEEIYGERHLYACEHHYRCKKCGEEMIVDSSG